MKTLKFVLYFVLLLAVIAVIGYFFFTGCRV